MEFLAEAKVIHEDLATRNILLFEGNVVKIADFGLAKSLYESENYIRRRKVPLPWRWMAVESLRNLEFSHKSDVRGFGVVLWEIFNYAEVPFLMESYSTEFMKKLDGGLRLEKPDLASEEKYNLMMECWDICADVRPTFTKCKEFLTYSEREAHYMTICTV